MKYIRTIRILVIMVVFSLAIPVLAAQLDFVSEINKVNVSERFWVDIMLDTQDETINAVSGVISYPKDKLRLIDYSDGDSIVTLWVDQPNIEETESDFVGVIPGGFSGVLSPFYEGSRPGKILSVKFEAISGGPFSITSIDTEVLLHDGLGTPAVISINSFDLDATEDIILSPPRPEEIVDLDPPEPFTFEVIRDENIADDQFVVIFNTVDKGSGIDYYEIKEGRKQFERAISPYVLKNQYLDEAIVVRAVDKAGNIQASRVGPPKPRSFLDKYGKWGIIIALITIILVSYILRRKYSQNAK